MSAPPKQSDAFRQPKPVIVGTYRTFPLAIQPLQPAKQYPKNPLYANVQSKVMQSINR